MPTPQIKVCGLTRAADIAAAEALGADYFGVVAFKDSPRGVGGARAAALAAKMPRGRRVLVDVAPSAERLAAHRALGFDFYQLHFDAAATSPAQIALWARTVGRAALWLAPRLAHASAFPESLLDVADTFLLDAPASGVYGGSGQTGDWGFFARLKDAYPEKRWILAGGLRSENVADALAATQAEVVDVNSGVESAAGVKDARKLAAFFAAARAV